jgi:hypothetical protein
MRRTGGGIRGVRVRSAMSTGSAAVSTTCLELSQEDGAAHKFYEVSVADLVVTVRYGRIGAAGQRRRVLPGAR